MIIRPSEHDQVAVRITNRKGAVIEEGRRRSFDRNILGGGTVVQSGEAVGVAAGEAGVGQRIRAAMQERDTATGSDAMPFVAFSPFGVHVEGVSVEGGKLIRPLRLERDMVKIGAGGHSGQGHRVTSAACINVASIETRSMEIPARFRPSASRSMGGAVVKFASVVNITEPRSPNDRVNAGEQPLPIRRRAN